MSQVIDIDDYRAENKVTALSASMTFAYNQQFPYLIKEVLAPLSDIKSVETTIFDVLKYFSDPKISENRDTSNFFNYTNATHISVNEDPNHLRHFELRFHYHKNNLRAEILINIYTHDFTEKQNDDLLEYLYTLEK